VPTLTFYPDAHPESTSVDGRVSSGEKLTWAEAIADAGFEYNDTALELAVVHFDCSSIQDKYIYLVRGIFLFDTSAIPAGATILYAYLWIHGAPSKVDTHGWLPDVNVYAAAPASDDALIATDFASLGSTPFCDTPIGYNSWLDNGYNIFALNAAGLAAIAKGGITKLGLRNANYDVAGKPPEWVETYGLDACQLVACCAEKGDGYKPKLVVTYTVAPTVTTDPATGVSHITAMLNGTLDDDGGEACDCGFEYGLTNAYGTTTPTQSKTTGQTFSQGITGLSPNTTYHFRAIATNSAGTSYGSDKTFTTRARRGNINVDQLIYQHTERMERFR